MKKIHVCCDLKTKLTQGSKQISCNETSLSPFPPLLLFLWHHRQRHQPGRRGGEGKERKRTAEPRPLIPPSPKNPIILAQATPILLLLLLCKQGRVTHCSAQPSSACTPKCLGCCCCRCCFLSSSCCVQPGERERALVGLSTSLSSPTRLLLFLPSSSSSSFFSRRTDVQECGREFLFPRIQEEREREKKKTDLQRKYERRRKVVEKKNINLEEEEEEISVKMSAAAAATSSLARFVALSILINLSQGKKKVSSCEGVIAAPPESIAQDFWQPCLIVIMGATHKEGQSILRARSQDLP